MTIEELKEILKKEDVNTDSIILPPDKYAYWDSGRGLEIRGDKFIYFEESRHDRRKDTEKVFDDENEACQYLLKELTAYGCTV